MSEPDTSFTIRRILVALDASPHSLAALEAAADLAAKMEADLLGLFVEDVELLRMADSPYAREILYPSATETPLNRATMERNLRARSEQARQALASAAQRAQVQWSFRTVRGQVTSEVLAAAADVDLLAIGKIGWSFGTRVRIGSTALELATSRIPVLLFPERGVFRKLPLLVYYDGSPATKRAVLASAQLAGSGKKRITLLIAAANPESARAMENDIEASLTGKDIEIRYRHIDPNDELSLLRALKAEETGILVLGSREVLKKLRSVEGILRDSEIPVLLLGNAS